MSVLRLYYIPKVSGQVLNASDVTHVIFAVLVFLSGRGSSRVAVMFSGYETCSSWSDIGISVTFNVVGLAAVSKLSAMKWYMQKRIIVY